MKAARSGRRSSAQTAGRPEVGVGVGEQWNAGSRCGGAAEEGTRLGGWCMGRREDPADRIGGERCEAPERARRTSGRTRSPRERGGKG